MKRSNDTSKAAAARVIEPTDIIGARAVAVMLGITQASVTRRVQAGTLPVLAKLDGARGAYVFDRNDIAAAVDS